MGMALSSLNVPCQKAFSSLLCLTKDEVAACEPSNCIRCGRCISVCPAGLMPTKLSEIADKGDFALFDQLNGCECVECGCCSYICPAKRRLTQSMKTGRREALAGTQNTTSASAPATSGFRVSINARASEGVLFIFQFPAIIFFLM